MRIYRVRARRGGLKMYSDNKVLKEENERLKNEIKRHKATIKNLKYQIKEITAYKHCAGIED